MQPGLYKFIARTNADLSESWTNQDDEGVAINMSVGWTAITQFRTAPGEVPVLEMSTSNGRITLGADGSVKHFVAESVMRSLAAFEGFFDTLIIDPTGKVDCQVAGPAEIVRGISKVGGGT